MDKELVRKTSKFLSYVLRHAPESIDIELDAQGWVSIDRLLAQADASGRSISRSLLEHVVETNDKQRFAISDDGNQIRANQGHSVDVDLALQPVTPPDKLFHGTVGKFLDAIRNEGLLKGQRQHVHLSKDKATATNVGQRRGKPIILVIRAKELSESGCDFFLSKNGVWLCDHVPPEFIEFP